MRTVVFYEVFDEERLALERYSGGKFCVRMFKEPAQELNDQKSVKGLVSIRTQSVLSPRQLDSSEGILTRSTGYDHVLAYAQKGIPCGFLPSYCSQAVAEQAMIMVLALLRKLPRQMIQIFDFCRDGLTGMESGGRNLLIVGVGKIGRECVAMAKALHMNVKGVDIDPREKDVDYVKLDDGLRWADAIISAVPLTEQTKDMFSRNIFEKMKPDSVFVNVSRGEVSPFGEIEHALEKGLLGGVGLDVYDQEPFLATALRKERNSRQKEKLKKLPL